MGAFLVGACRVLLAWQAAQATVAGTVLDGDTGEPLARAVVALADLDRAAATDARGAYILRDVPAGPQHLTVRSLGYAPRTLHALVPRAGELRINISLRPEPIPLHAIEVHSPVAVRGVEVDDDVVFPDRSISIAAVHNHPLLAESDAFESLDGGVVALSPETPSGVYIRGGAPDQTAYVLDGIPVFNPYHAAGVFSAWNPDALSRLRVSSTAPSPALPDALSGAVAAVTRTPGSRLGAQGGLSTTQARLTVDGPLGSGGAGYLVSVRQGLPGLFAPKDEASYLRGETSDWLAKVEAPLLGGRLRMLGYDGENEIRAVATGQDASEPDPKRNIFEWSSRSAGAVWTRTFPGFALRVQGWTASGAAGAVWGAAPDPGASMAGTRRDEGMLATLERRASRATTAFGIRLERSTTAYRVDSDSAGGGRWAASARTPVAMLFVERTGAIGRRAGFELGVSGAVAAGGVYIGPRARLQWSPSERLTLSGSAARLHQFAQSLRNTESVAGSIFPVDLYLGAAAPDVPVARSDQTVVAAEYRPAAGVRLEIQAHERAFDGLLLVAPRGGDPFATEGFATGSGAARGVSLDAAASGARYGVVASYGWQRVRLEAGGRSYVPERGVAHRIEAGVIAFPTAMFSVRLGVTGALGRRATPVVGDFEWEACNVRDRGCEFGGSPSYDPSTLGATALPPYLRVDLGARKHWHVDVAGRDSRLALFGTITNVFGRTNVLTYARQPLAGAPTAITMRPLAPLTAGLDLRF